MQNLPDDVLVRLPKWLPAAATERLRGVCRAARVVYSRDDAWRCHSDRLWRRATAAAELAIDTRSQRHLCIVRRREMRLSPLTGRYATPSGVVLHVAAYSRPPCWFAWQPRHEMTIMLELPPH